MGKPLPQTKSALKQPIMLCGGYFRGGEEVEMDKMANQKKMRVILLKGGLRYLEDIRDVLEGRIKSIELEINELMDEIRQEKAEED